MTTNTYDVVVIGGGPAGVTAALRAKELGASVALIERGLLGGTCTNDGCVPTRVLAKAARLLRDTQQFAEYGLEAPKPEVHFVRVLERAQQVVYQMHEKKQLVEHLEALDIATYQQVGDAAFVSPQKVRLQDGTELEGKQFILCVGGHARRLDFPGAEHALTHSDVWQLTSLPASVAIVGSGATGSQIASVLNAFGSKVSLLEVMPRLLPTEDEAVSDAMTHEFEQRGLEVVTGIKTITRIEKHAQGIDIVFEKEGNEERRTVETVILSVGWPGNLDKLNLDAAGVNTKGPYIEVNDALQTSASHIYAAGDVTGRMMLVQSANYQARLAAENAVLGQDRPDPNNLVPRGGFTDPEYASVGMTEEQAREKYECAVAVVPYTDIDRAVIDDHTTGFCKLIADRTTRRIVGASVVGEQAVEVVQLVAVAMAGDMPVEQLADVEFAYPTYATIVGLAARQLARELKVVPVADDSPASSRPRPAEWERSQNG